jgi:hypothetical protein
MNNKLLSAAEWAAARADRRYDGAAVRALPGSVPVAEAVAALLP